MGRSHVGLAFALGVAVGVGAAWFWMRPAEHASDADATSENGASTAPDALSAHEPTLAASGSAASARPNAVRSDQGRTAAPVREDAPASTTPVDGHPWIEVTAVPAEGIPADFSGTAYALPAGSPGAADDSGAPHAKVSTTVPARVAVPRAGRYDVGVAWSGGHVLKQDVIVDATGTTRATIELPRCAPVRVVASGRWPSSVAKGANGDTFHLRVGLYPRGDVPSKKLGGQDVGETTIKITPRGIATWTLRWTR